MINDIEIATLRNDKKVIYTISNNDGELVFSLLDRISKKKLMMKK